MSNLIGTINRKNIFYERYSPNLSWIENLPKNNWLLLAIVDNEEKNKFFEIANAIIDSNACFACCAGLQGELLHDIIDETIIEREVYDQYLPPFDIITTWHNKDSLENILWYSVFTARNDPEKINTVICLDESEQDLQEELTSFIKRFSKGYIPPDR